MRAFRSVAITLALSVPATAASAEQVFGLTSGNSVVTFDTASPNTITSTRSITGLAAGDTLTGIDLRPSDRNLYSVATSGNLYRLTLSGGSYTASLVAPLATADGTPIILRGSRFGIDFNPVADRLRLITDFDQNLRINVDNGVTIVDGTLSGPGAEAYTAAAYTNNVAGATSTMLYALDASGNQLALSSSPNDGIYNDIGVVTGIDFGGLNNVGFDISGRTGAAFFSNGSGFYSIDLGTAAATSLGTIGSGSLVGFTLAGVPEPATWAMMIGGFGAVGGMMRRRHRRTALAIA